MPDDFTHQVKSTCTEDPLTYGIIKVAVHPDAPYTLIITLLWQ